MPDDPAASSAASTPASTGTSPGTATGADWDPEFTAMAHGDLLPRLARQAFGDRYPLELRPYGATTWPLLHRVHAELTAGQDQRSQGQGQGQGGSQGLTLLDLGCGEGGPGLWLARAAGARLLGLDFSIAALRTARRTAASFPQAPPSQFVAASFDRLCLRDGSVDAAVSFDAFTYLSDTPAALAELARVLRPEGRFALTVHEVAGGTGAEIADYRPLVAAAGLRILGYDEVPDWLPATRRNYQLWLEHADELHAELGEPVAATLLAEAADLLPRLSGRRQMLLVGTRT